MKIHSGWASAAVLAAAMMASSPAVAQDPAPHKPAATKKAPAKAAPSKAGTAKAAPVKKAPPKKTAAEAVEEQTEAAAEEAPPEKAEAAEAAEATEEAPPAEETAAEATAEDEGQATEEDWAKAEGNAEEAEEPAAPQRRAPRRARPPVVPSAEVPGYVGPYTMDYIEGAEVPPGYIKVERIRKGLVIAGAVTFGVSWLVSATAGVALTDESNHNECYAYGDDIEGGGGYYSECRDDDNEGAIPLFIPLVGPFIAMGTMDAEGPGRAALFLDGVVQVGGMAMLIAGVAAKQTVLVRSGNTTVSVAPGPGSVQFTGSF
jgi:hypothetical protein